MSTAYNRRAPRIIELTTHDSLLRDQDGGYDHQFVDKEAAAKFECPLCLLVAREAQQVTCCGKIFCNTCLDQIRSSNNKCPACRVLLSSFKDARADQEIRSLQISCDILGEEGERCSHKCELRDIDSHYKTCPYVRVLCANDCGIKVQRSKLVTHAQQDCPKRLTSCIYCDQQGTHEYITGEHCETCVNALLCCPIEDCTEMVKKCDMSTHIDTCPNCIVYCDYRHYGCDLPVKRKDLSNHYKVCTDLHLRLTVAKVEELGVGLAKVQFLVQDKKWANKENMARNEKRINCLQLTIKLLALSIAVTIIFIFIINKH